MARKAKSSRKSGSAPPAAAAESPAPPPPTPVEESSTGFMMFKPKKAANGDGADNAGDIALGRQMTRTITAIAHRELESAVEDIVRSTIRKTLAGIGKK